MNIEQKIAEIENRFEESELVFGHGTDNAWDESAWIVLKALRIDLGADVVENNIPWQKPLSRSELDAIENLVEIRITNRKPFAYLVNETWFAGNRFFIDERAIVPRSYLGEWIPESFVPWINPEKIHSVLDLCAGCGCIAISCALVFPDAKIVASDLSDSALDVARINVKNYGLENQISVHCGEGFDGITQTFDLIVCNPPYVSNKRMNQLPEEFLHEPDSAFRGGEDGLNFIVPLLQRAENHLTNDGTLFVEAGSASHALEAWFPDIAFTWLSTEYDEMVVFMITAEELRGYATILNSN